MRNTLIKNEIIERLIAEFQFKETTDFLRQGVCPSCGKKELYINKQHPWMLRCGRLNNCGYEEKTRDLYKDVFENLNEEYEATTQNPTATADAYMQLQRGFSLVNLKGAYRQGSFYSSRIKKKTATVVFDICKENNVYMERFVETLYIPDDDGEIEPRQQNFNGSYQGLFWNNPLQSIKPDDTVYITEACIDAISLQQNGYKAVAALTCYNYPKKSIEQLDPHKTINWVWALDGDKAGRKYMAKFALAMQDEGYKSCAAVPPHGKEKTDWNDLHQSQEITSEQMEEYRYQGGLLTARTALAKALLIWNKRGTNTFPLDFNNRTYWFSMNIEKFGKTLEKIKEQAEESGEIISDKELREKAADEANNIYEIANCSIQFLYYQRNELTDESWYYARVTFPHRGKPIKLTFSNSQILASSKFSERLLVAPGAVFDGNSTQLTRLVKPKIFDIKTVSTVDFIGYSREHNTYIFNDKAVHKGRIIDINEEDYFEVGKKSIKSLTRTPEIVISTSHKYQDTWVKHVWACWGPSGFAALAFWFGSLFAEQIRAKQESYPFLELVGEPGSGKSTLLEFLWMLYGRKDHEGFDPSKATAAARARNMSQVANLPVVFLEGDREDDDKSRSRSMDWNEMKTAYNGRPTRSRGLKNSGNETYEPPFRATVVISQNADVSASEAILQRIVHIKFTRENHTAETKAAADWLAKADMQNLSYFLLKGATQEEAVLKILTERQPIYEQKLLENPEIKTVRIAKNHAQIMALVDALSTVISITKEQRAETLRELAQMAVDRQQAIGADHPMVAQFWETFYYLNDAAATVKTEAQRASFDESDFDFDNEEEKEFAQEYIPGLNHSKDPNLIAVNLNEFDEIRQKHNQQMILMSGLKKLLKASRSHKFKEVKVVNSAITQKSKKCWVFEKPQRGKYA